MHQRKTTTCTLHIDRNLQWQRAVSLRQRRGSYLHQTRLGDQSFTVAGMPVHSSGSHVPTSLHRTNIQTTTGDVPV